MDTSSWEKTSIFITLFEASFFWHHVWVTLISHHHTSIWSLSTLGYKLVLFTGNKSILKIFHDSEELFKRHLAIRIEIQFLEKINSFLRISTKWLHDSLQIVHIYNTGLLLIEHVKDASEIFNLLGCVLLENIEFIGIDVLLELFDSLRVYSCFVKSIDVSSIFGDLWRLRVWIDLLFFCLLFSFLLIHHWWAWLLLNNGCISSLIYGLRSLDSWVIDLSIHLLLLLHISWVVVFNLFIIISLYRLLDNLCRHLVRRGFLNIIINQIFLRFFSWW